MSKSLTRLFLSLVMLVSPALALAQNAGSSVNNLPVSPPIVGTQLTYCPVGSSNDYKCTFAQVAAFVSANLAAGAAATNLGFVPAPANNPTFTGTVTLPAGTAATNLGFVPAPVNNPTFTGTATFSLIQGVVKSVALTDYGAKCDGVTDDTTAIQNWLNQAAPQTVLGAPDGVCLFSSALQTPYAGQYTIQGAGQQSTVFRYVGANTTTDLLTVNTTAGGVAGVVIRDFRIDSTTTMTGGFALHAHGLFDSQITNVALDSVNSSGSASSYGKLCGGFWIDGAGGVDMHNPYAFSEQNCSDGIRVNSGLGGNAELRVVGGDVGGIQTGTGAVTGFLNAYHMAGGFGGFRIDGTSEHNSVHGLVIDTAVVATANREFDLGSTGALDSNQNDDVYVNDTLAYGGTVDIAGWVASALAGHGIVIHAWANGDVQLRGNKIYNHCGSGVLIDDASAHVSFSSATAINGNGTAGLASCVTWKGLNPGHGYGVEASVATSNITGLPTLFNNSAGPFNGNTGLMLSSLASISSVGSLYTLSNPNGDAVLALDAGSTKASAFRLTRGGTVKWQTVNDNFGSADQFGIIDAANAYTAWLEVTTGGNATIGEGSSNILTVNGDITLPNIPASAGGSGLYVCADSTGKLYRKATCP